MVSPVKRQLKRLCYYGWNRQCPICGRTFRRFAPGGAERRPDAECPYCYSKERHRLFYLYLQKEQAMRFEGKKMLHFAPEFCLTETFAKSKGLLYVSADLYEPAVSERVNICAIPHPDSTFDYILCFHILEHVPDDRLALSEMRRVLKRGGHLLLMIPVYEGKTIEDASVRSPRKRLELFGQEDHVRKYGRDFFIRLHEAGFIYKELAAHDIITNPAQTKRFGASLQGESLIVATPA